MITVLIVEDDVAKLGELHNSVIAAGVPESRIRHALTVFDAINTLKAQRFDVMLLDINLPRRLGEHVTRGAGVEVLKRITRDGLHRPNYIIGVTAFADAFEEFEDQFTQQLWSLVLYSANSDYWRSQIVSHLEYVTAAMNSHNFSDGVTYGIDVAIICALPTVEFEAVKRLDWGWQPLRLPHDETAYLSGVYSGTGGRSVSAVAAAAPRIGMPASAVLSTKMIMMFRPRYLIMAGICAGRKDKVQLGDIVVADPCWDWGSGKIEGQDNRPIFRPAPHQIEMDVDLAARLGELTRDPVMLARIRATTRSKKPATELKAHLGPLASGAAVVADADAFNTLIDQHRGLLAIEMEGYGVALACRGAGKPRPQPIIIKSVCDFADKDKADDFQEYAAETSALFLQAVIDSLLGNN